MSESLEYLFGSKLKLRILKTLILNSSLSFTASEIAGRIKCPMASVRSELEKMKKVELVLCKIKKKKKNYTINRDFPFYPEIKKVVSKCTITPESKTLKGIKTAGSIIYAALTGIFTDNRKAVVDLLVVGDSLRKTKIRKIVAELEAETGKEIRYSILSSKEMFYRMEMFDKFITEIMGGPKLVLVDKIQQAKKKLRSNFHNGQ